MRPLVAFDAAFVTPAVTLHLLVAIAGLASASANSGLRIDITHPTSCTRRSQNGDHIRVHYNGTLEKDGTPFDSSYGRGEPFDFTLGAGKVIKGWDQGLVGMCIGESRRLTIPPELGYGNYNMGSIPAGSTLVFDTKLMGIDGVEAESTPSSEDPEPIPPIVDVPPPPPPPPLGSEGGPKYAGENDGECRLLGPFALLVQGALGALALLSLVWKRYRETPRRPLKIWWFDASKQVFGSAMLHLANLFMSMLSSGRFDVAAKTSAQSFVQGESEKQPNPCSFYLLNLAIDTTVGIPILVFLLRILHHAALLTPLGNPPESLRSGNYGQPPRVLWWLKQSFLYFLGLFGMKLCVFFIFQLLPWIAWVGDWALRWTEGNEAIQITFVMLIFPLIMNALQYYIIDGFIKDPAGGDGHVAVPNEELDSDSEDEDGTGRRRGRISSEDDESDGYLSEHEIFDRHTHGRRQGVTGEALKEANPLSVRIRPHDFDEMDGASSHSRTLTARSEDDDDKEVCGTTQS